MTSLTPPKPGTRSDFDPTRAARVADGALSWIEDNLAAFQPLSGKPEPDPVLEQRVCELAVVCVALSRDPQHRRDARLQHFLEFLTPLAKAPLLRARFVRRSAGLVPTIAVLSALRECCVREDLDDLAGLVQRLLDSGNASSMRLPTHEMLALRYFLDMGGFSHAVPPYHRLARASLLGRPINPLYLSDAEVYVITHLLFWLSDLGARDLSMLSRSQLPRTVWTVEQLTGMYVHLRNWDLVGELLLACSCLGARHLQVFRVGWERLAAAQREDGAVPSLRYEAEEAKRLTRGERRTYEFRHCSHPTLVAALAGTVCSSQPAV